MEEGVVINFRSRRGLGLVATDDGDELVFSAHDIRDPALEKPKTGQRIAFQRGKSRDGQLRAYHLQTVR
jgi:cold shock CspA family protein